MDIEALGQTPYRILEVHEENPLLEATVELLEDDPQPGPQDVSTEICALYGKCTPNSTTPRRRPSTPPRSPIRSPAACPSTMEPSRNS